MVFFCGHHPIWWMNNAPQMSDFHGLKSVGQRWAAVGEVFQSLSLSQISSSMSTTPINHPINRWYLTILKWVVHGTAWPLRPHFQLLPNGSIHETRRHPAWQATNWGYFIQRKVVAQRAITHDADATWRCHNKNAEVSMFQHPLETHLHQPSIIVLKIHQLIGHLASRGSFLVGSYRQIRFLLVYIICIHLPDFRYGDPSYPLRLWHLSIYTVMDPYQLQNRLPLEWGEITELEEVMGGYSYYVYNIYIYI